MFNEHSNDVYWNEFMNTKLYLKKSVLNININNIINI